MSSYNKSLEKKGEETKYNKELPEDERNEWMKHIPLRKFGTVEDIANMATILASDMSSYITGQVITVDGGFLC